jgi:zinc finger CCCH domain-containing protein 13
LKVLTEAAAREDLEEQEANERRRARREKHERHKRERNGEVEREPRERGDRERGERRRRHRDRGSNSESDSSDEQDYVEDKPKLLEAPASKKKSGGAGGFEEPLMSGGLGDSGGPGGERDRGGREREVDPLGLTNMSNLRENPDVPGQYLGYVRNPPLPSALK